MTQPFGTFFHLTSVNTNLTITLMKKICLWVLTVLFTLPALSQTKKGFVYLKNGSVLKGKYAFTGNDQKVVVLSAGNTWVFSASEVDSISSRRLHDQPFNETNAIDSKFFYRVELGVLVGNRENSQSAPFSLTGSVNYQLKPKLSLGLGSGVEFLKESFLPVFVNAEYRFREWSSTPYLFLKVGAQLPVEESNAVYYDVIEPWYDYFWWPGPTNEQKLTSKGGFLINPGIGFQRMFSPGFGLNFAVGYQFHRLNYSGENDYELDIDYNRLTIKLGIIFN